MPIGIAGTEKIILANRTEMPGLPARLRTYFRVMFPLWVNVPAGLLMFWSFSVAVRAAQGLPMSFGLVELRGAVTVLLCMLLPRLLDELKDEDIDASLFPHRPLVTGEVLYSDIRFLTLGAILLAVGLNLGGGPSTAAFLLFFALLVLSWQWWMFPQFVASRTGLVLLTHQPLAPALLLYVYALNLEATGATPDFYVATLLCVIFWFPLFAWEIGRKVRSPQDETEYWTYSRMWGPRAAALVPVLALTLAGGLMAASWKKLGAGTGFAAGHVLLILVMAAGSMPFLVAPAERRCRVRSLVEGYIFGFHLLTAGWLTFQG